MHINASSSGTGELWCFHVSHLSGTKGLLLPSRLWSPQCIGTVCSKPGILASSCPSFVQLCFRYQEAVTVPQAIL